MPDISLTDFSSQQAELSRRKRLADLLQQQAAEPIQIQSYKNTQAPIPWTAVLAKALAGAGSAYQASRERKDAETLKAAQLAQTQRVYGDYFGTGQQGAPPPQAANPYRNDDYAAAAQGAPQAVGPRPMPSPQMAQQPQAMPSPQGPPVAPPQAPPAPQAPPQVIPVAQGPQAAPAPPVAAPPPTQAAPELPQPMDPQAFDLAQRSDVAREKLQKALRFASYPGNTAAAAPLIKDAQEELSKIHDAQTAMAQKEAERKADVGRATTLVGQMNVPEDLRPTLQAVALAGGTGALKPAVAAIVQHGLTPKERYMTPQEKQAAGLPADLIVAVNEQTNEPKIVYNPHPDQEAAINAKLHAQEVALSGARLGLESQRFAFDRSQKENALLTPDATKFAAEQLLSGDPSPLQNMGRGTQGAANVVAVRNEMYRQAAAKGISPQQLANINAQFFGQKAEARAAGTRVGATDVATNEVPPLADEAKYRHDALKAQGNLVPWNQAVQMVQRGTSSPELARAVAVNTAVTNAYGRSFGTGVLADNARKEAAAQLQTAWGTGAYDAALDQIVRNTTIERHGARGALTHVGNDTALPPPPGRAAVHQPYADPAKEARYQAWLKANGH